MPLVRAARLEHVFERATLDGIDRLLNATRPGDDDERQGRMGPFDSVEQLESAHAS